MSRQIETPSSRNKASNHSSRNNHSKTTSSHRHKVIAMARICLVYVGIHKGVKVYAPLDKPDEEIIADRQTLVCDMKSDKSMRTHLQNRSIHKFFSMLAKALNNAGWDMKRTLTKQADIPWSETTVKEHLWRPIQKAMYNTESTAKLQTEQVSAVYDTLNRHTGEKLGVSIPFPSYESQVNQALYGDKK